MTTTAEQRRAYFSAPTAAALSTTSTLPSYMLTSGQTQALLIYKTQWANLKLKTRHKLASLEVESL